MLNPRAAFADENCMHEMYHAFSKSCSYSMILLFETIQGKFLILWEECFNYLAILFINLLVGTNVRQAILFLFEFFLQINNILVKDRKVKLHAY